MTKIMEKCDIVARWMYATWALYLVSSGIFSQTSASALMVESEGYSGLAVIITAATVFLVLLLDVFVNDALPEQYRFCWALRNRHFVYTSASFLFLMPLFTVAKFDAIDLPQVIFYGGAALFGWILGIRDISRRQMQWAT
jgi:hypothetical protein